MDDVGGDRVVKLPHVFRQEGPMTRECRFVTSTRGSGLPFPGVALKSALRQPQHQVAQQGFGKTTLVKKSRRSCGLSPNPRRMSKERLWWSSTSLSLIHI